VPEHRLTANGGDTAIRHDVLRAQLREDSRVVTPALRHPVLRGYFSLPNYGFPRVGDVEYC